jgi:ferredoxin-type protein NapH
MKNAIYTNYFTDSKIKKSGLSLLGLGFLFLLICLTGVSTNAPIIFLFLSLGLMVIGGLTYIIPQIKEAPAGIKNNKIFFNIFTSRGSVAWLLGIIFTAFYFALYWFPELIKNWIVLVNPLSYLLKGQPADRWFLYGTFYTLAVLVMGTRMIIKYRHNRYHIIRTCSVMFFQLGFAFLIPAILDGLNQPEFYFTYFWPLKYQYLFPNEISYLTQNGTALGYFMIFWGAAMIFIATPILTYFFGKRWYCSWVCGCGGLAETAGDPFRQLSDKSLKSWKVERWSIHSVLVFVILTTALVWLNSATKGAVLGSVSHAFDEAYGFIIGSVFSGIVGVGFYPIFGSRVWCRFGCPMAAILGMQQRLFSRFRITTNGGQCISCGNCSTYCEMGIDVKSYAQRGQNIIRSSCVGCGICAAVCPRGVLKLENLPRAGRYDLQN